MKICPVCKSAVPDDAEYCGNCGNDGVYDNQQYKSLKKIKTFFMLSEQDKMQLNHRDVYKIPDTFVDNGLVPMKVEMSFKGKEVDLLRCSDEQLWEILREGDILRCSLKQLSAILINLQNKKEELEHKIRALQNE